MAERATLERWGHATARMSPTSLLLPPPLRDWLGENHLAYFISETIDQLDLSAFHRCYQGDGRRNRPYHPTMLVKVLIYAYAREAAISAAQGAGGTGVWMAEARVRIPSIFLARPEESTRRMEFTDDGVEPAADGDDGGRPGVDLGAS